MRVAIFAGGEIFGGAERQILSLLHGLRGLLEAPAELVCIHDGELASRARDFGPVHILHPRRKLDIGTLRQLRSILEKGRFDVVSVHGYRATVLLAAALPFPEFHVVKTEHGSVEIGSCRMGERLRATAYRVLELLGTHLLRATLVYVTSDLETLLSYGRLGLSHTVVNNGIDLSDFSRNEDLVRPPSFRQGAFNLVCIGRLEAIKGFDVAVRSMRSENMPDHAELHIVGTGPMHDTLRQLSQDLGVENRVVLHGFQANVYGYIANADAVLIPSHHEGLPYSLLESLALGAPVIASAVGGLKELLTDRHTALLGPAGDPVFIARSVRRLSREEGLSATLSTNGRALIDGHLTSRVMAQRYLDVFGRRRPTELQSPRGGN